MKKTVSIIALFALFIISVSANADRVVQAAEGCIAPAIEINDTTSGATTLADLKGKWTLINFWDSCDPVSRIAASDYDDLAATMTSGSDFTLLSVNLDSNKEIYREVSRRDNLSEGTQINVNLSESPRLAADYYLDRSRNAYLVDPRGVIVAVNPTPAYIRRLIRR